MLKYKDIKKILLSKKLSTKQQTFFAKKLSFLMSSGLPMLECIHLLKSQSSNTFEKDICKKILDDLSNGQSLATSLSKTKGVFNDFSINIIRAGESSGTLSENLNYLAEELSKKESLRKKILGALLYPFIVTIATFGITGLLITYIFPKILPIFQSLNTKLPFSTRIIIFLSNVLRHDWFYILTISLFVFFTTSWLIKTKPKIRLKAHGYILHMPFFGSIVQHYNIANSCRTLGMLLRSGITLQTSIDLTTRTIDNLQFQNSFKEMSQYVINGKSISGVMKKDTHIFPVMLGHMVTVGEKSGNLSETLMYLSKFYENEFEDQTKNLSSAIEPVLMVLMGCIVGFVAISVITPIYEITNNLKN